MFAPSKEVRRRLAAKQTALGVTFDPGVKLHLTPVQRDAAIQTLSSLEATVEYEVLWLADCEGANEAIAAGAATREAVETSAHRRLAEAESKL